MSGDKWTKKQLETLRFAAESKPDYITDLELSRRLSTQLNKSTEAIRWRLRSNRAEAKIARPPKILILDIETLPIEALVFDVWKQNIYMEQVERDWSILCYSAKWLFDKNVFGAVVTAEEAKEHRDDSIIESVWELLNEADMVVTHNGDNFDLKRLNARFFVHGMPKPMFYKSIDTKTIAVKEMGLTYNKLDWIAGILGVGRKIETGFRWWKECHNGNQKYLDLMLKYNKWDVKLEEDVYLRLRPWITSHPNVSLFAINSDVAHCPACGGLDLHWNGKYQAPVTLYKAFRCQDCGAIGYSTKKEYKIQTSIAK